MPPIDHECALTDVVVELSNELAKLKHELAQLKKSQFGPKSERTKMPRPDAGKHATADERLATRRANAASDVGYVYASDRSGETPKRILDGTSGYLLVDGYSGYNVVTEVSTRKRAACHAHLRRYFHEALPTAPVAQEAIDLILELYRVEREVSERNIAHTTEHHALRKTASAEARMRLKAWLDRERPRHPPKSPISAAIRYGLGQWDELGRFLDDMRIPLDNNASERSLRRVALGRKNFLFVGDVESGGNIAGLYTLVATCEARGLNPFAYLADVIARVQDHPARQLDDLLPGPWAQARAA